MLYQFVIWYSIIINLLKPHAFYYSHLFSSQNSLLYSSSTLVYNFKLMYLVSITSNLLAHKQHILVTIYHHSKTNQIQITRKLCTDSVYKNKVSHV